jgi:hypothetical protein
MTEKMRFKFLFGSTKCGMVDSMDSHGEFVLSLQFKQPSMDS